MPIITPSEMKLDVLSELFREETELATGLLISESVKDIAEQYKKLALDDILWPHVVLKPEVNIDEMGSLRERIRALALPLLVNCDVYIDLAENIEKADAKCIEVESISHEREIEDINNSRQLAADKGIELWKLADACIAFYPVGDIEKD